MKVLLISEIITYILTNAKQASPVLETFSFLKVFFGLKWAALAKRLIFFYN